MKVERSCFFLANKCEQRAHISLRKQSKGERDGEKKWTKLSTVAGTTLSLHKKIAFTVAATDGA